MLRDTHKDSLDHIPALDLNTRNQAIDEASSAFSGPEPDYEDWDSGERYAERGDSSPDYYDMFSCLLERG